MKIMLAGDVCPTDITAPLFEAQDVETLFADAAEIFKGNDVNFVNLECALGHGGNKIKKFGPNLLAPVETADVLKKLGVNLVGISNNHFFDYGRPALKESMEAFEKAGLDTVGFGENYEDSRKNYVVEKNGETVCFIAVCEHEYTYALPDRMGCRPFDEFDTIWDIREAKAKYDKVIVIYHGGKEYSAYPSPRVRRAFHAMAKNGADIVVGQHSHCICCYEQVEGSHLIYGQGNFHFIWKDMPECWYSALEVVYDTEKNSVEFIPTVQSIEKKGIYLAKGEEKEALLKAFEERNKSLLDGSWIEGWREFVENEKWYYLEAIEKACAKDATERDNAVFGHYLDCEAHTDVWRELFPTYNQTNERD